MIFKPEDKVNGVGLFSYVRGGTILRRHEPFWVVRVPGSLKYPSPHYFRTEELVLAKPTLVERVKKVTKLRPSFKHLLRLLTIGY